MDQGTCIDKWKGTSLPIHGDCGLSRWNSNVSPLRGDLIGCVAIIRFGSLTHLVRIVLDSDLEAVAEKFFRYVGTYKPAYTIVLASEADLNRFAEIAKLHRMSRKAALQSMQLELEVAA